MTQESQSPFSNDEADPFTTSASDTRTTQQEDPSSWQTNAKPLNPRWQLLTTEEKKEQDSIIRKLESKLKKLDQAKANPNYTKRNMPDILRQFESLEEDSSDGEEEQEDLEPAEEENEGLPLLWESRNMDHIPKKNENQYTSSNYIQWLQWCFPCCQ